MYVGSKCVWWYTRGSMYSYEILALVSIRIPARAGGREYLVPRTPRLFVYYSKYLVDMFTCHHMYEYICDSM